MTKFKNIIPFTVLATGCLSFDAAADIVRNPLYDLDHKKLCELQEEGEGPKKNMVMPKAITVEDGGFWQVERDYVISTLLSRYALTLDYNELNREEGKKISTLIVDKLLACERNNADQRTCNTDYGVSDEIRFKNNFNSLRFRRALLRLFESAETGSSTEFVVVRRDGGEPVSDTFHDTYRPMINGALDDKVIAAFVESTTPPFAILCKGQDGVDKPTKVTVSLPAYSDDKTYDNVHQSSFSSTELGRKIVKFGQTERLKFVARQSPSELSLDSGKGMEVGITEAGEKDAIIIDAAIGLQVKALDTDKSKLTVTPFIAMDQEPVAFKFFNPEKNFEEDSKKIAFADISIGARFDYEWKRPRLVLSGSDLNSGRLRSIAGKPIPGLRIGGTVERFTDNYKGQLGNRFGVDLSFPKLFNVPGFRQREELIYRKALKPGKRSRHYRAPSLFEGWSLEWDAMPTADYLNYDNNRQPFNFDTADPADRLNKDIFDTLLLGSKFEIELLKSNLFGSIAGDEWLSINANWTWKHGYDDAMISDGMGGLMLSDETDAEKFEASIDYGHPDFSGFSLGLKYQVGQNFRSLKDSETLAVTVGAKY